MWLAWMLIATFVSYFSGFVVYFILGKTLAVSLLVFFTSGPLITLALGIRA